MPWDIRPPAGGPHSTPLSLGSLAWKAPPNRGVRNKSCLRRLWGRRTNPGTEEWLLDPRKVRTKSGRPSWQARPGQTGLGFREAQKGKRVPRETSGSPKWGKECPARSEGGQRTRGETGRRDQEEVGFLVQQTLCFHWDGPVLSPGEPDEWHAEAALQQLTVWHRRQRNRPSKHW